MVRLALVAALLVALAACATSQPQPPSARDAAARAFADTTGLVYTPNGPGSHVLVEQRAPRARQQPVPAVSYFVFDQESGRVVFEEWAVRGTVAWEDDRHVRIRLVPGTVPRVEAGEAPGLSYRVDVRAGVRVDD